MNEHLCFCTDANDTQQVTTRCIIAPYFTGGSERSAFRERHAPSLQVPARLQAGGGRRGLFWVGSMASRSFFKNFYSFTNIL